MSGSVAKQYNNLCSEEIEKRYHIKKNIRIYIYVEQTLFLRIYIIDSIDITYVQGNQGSATCHVGSVITSSEECKVACDALNKKVGGVLSEGKPCYIAGTGRCKQDGRQNRNSRLVCKTFGIMIF